MKSNGQLFLEYLEKIGKTWESYTELEPLERFEIIDGFVQAGVEAYFEELKTAQVRILGE